MTTTIAYVLDVGWDSLFAEGVFSTLEAAKGARPEMTWVDHSDPVSGEHWYSEGGESEPAHITSYTLDEWKQR